MKKIIGIILIASMFASCGPSEEELEYRQKQINDSVAAIVVEPEVAEVKEVIPKRPTFYNASDFKLVPGTIIKWAPNDDDKIEEGFKTDKFFKCWVHLQQEDGSVKVMEVDEFAWRNLYTGDVLK